MFIVTVVFVVNDIDAKDFQEAVLRQAHNSLHGEQECHQFDVAVAVEEPGTFFLYEVYSDEDAFLQHLGTEHFKQFSRTVADWVQTKEVRKFAKLGP